MKNYLLPILLLFLVTASVFAAQTYVIGEIFTTTTCGYCPGARSALAEFYEDKENHFYFIPVIWQGNGNHISPEYNTRRNLYGITGIPSVRVNGNVVVHGYSPQQYDRYVTAYNQVVVRNAPMEITVSMETNEQDELVVSADVVMTGDITTQNNNIIFLLTYDLTGIMDPDYFASVKTYHAENFPLNEAGQEQTFTRNTPLDPSWEMDRLTAVVFVQNLESTNPIIYQAGRRYGRGITSLFGSNVQQGPPSLHVRFYNNSSPAYLIDQYEWDLNGDGEIDSTEENPVFVYDEPGTYTVTLRVSDGVDEALLTFEDYITVTEPTSVAGSISGVFKKEYAPYTIIGDVFVPEDGILIIEPGLEIQIAESSITVEGLLQIDANFDEPVLLTSSTFWTGLTLINSSEQNIIRNTVFQNINGTAMKIEKSTVEQFSNNFITAATNTTGTAALELQEADINVRNSLFVNNTGQTIVSFRQCDASFENNTLSHNNASEYHLLNDSSYLQIKNSIIRGTGTALESIGEGMVLAEYSNISGGYDGLFVIDADPLFEDPSEGAGTGYNGLEAVWYLQDGSPCIDTGNPATIYNDPADPANPGYALFPAKGALRNDMGAYGGSGTSFWVFIEDDLVISEPQLNLITAYPNPFNPSVTISLNNYSTLSDQPVSLTIHNTKGQAVRTLLQNEIPAQAEYYWDGMDNDNRTLPSGVYFIRLSSDKVSSARKVLLLK